MTTSIVTGGAGFVGSHLCDALLAGGEHVVCLDNLSTGQVRNLAHLRAHPRFSLVRGDVADGAAWAALPLARRVYHLASPASPPDYQRLPVETIRTNVVGTLHALDYARAHGARVLLTSTSEVYGDPQVHPQPEGYWGHVNPIGPRSCYDEGKRCAEALLLAHARQHGTEVRLARLFNTYGSRLRPDDGRVVSEFIVRALRGEPLPLHGEGRQTRSFCHVSDVVRGLRALMAQDALEGPVNLGNPQEVSMLALAREVQRLTGCSAGLQSLPGRPEDPLRRQPDIGLARQALGWQPAVTLQQGLADTIAWFRAQAAEPTAVAADAFSGLNAFEENRLSRQADQAPKAIN